MIGVRPDKGPLLHLPRSVVEQLLNRKARLRSRARTRDRVLARWR